MKKKKIVGFVFTGKSVLLTLCMVLTFMKPTPAQVIANWDPTGITGFGPSPWAPYVLDPHLTSSGLTRGTGVSTTGIAVNNGWGGTSWSGDENGTISFTLSPEAGYYLNVDSFNLNFRREVTGPAFGWFEYSVDSAPYTLAYSLGFVTTSPSGGSFSMLDLTAFPDLHHIAPGSTVTFRLTLDTTLGGGGSGPFYIYNGWAGTLLAKGLAFFGSVHEVCPVPSGDAVMMVTATTADISWDSIPEITGYEYVVSTSLSTPTGWIFTPYHHVHLSSLAPGTNYYFYLRAACDSLHTSNWTGLNFTTGFTNGISAETDPGNISLYPNPAGDFLHFDLGKNRNGKMVITNLTGQVYTNINVNSNKGTIGLEGFEPGVYLLRFEGENTRSVHWIVKK